MWFPQWQSVPYESCNTSAGCTLLPWEAAGGHHGEVRHDRIKDRMKDKSKGRLLNHLNSSHILFLDAIPLDWEAVLQGWQYQRLHKMQFGSLWNYLCNATSKSEPKVKLDPKSHGPVTNGQDPAYGRAQLWTHSQLSL